MSCNRVYIGRLPYRVHEKDIEKFFRGIGRIKDIMLKTGYCFVEFDDYREADDAVYECNGQYLCGERVVVEHAKGTPHGEDLKRDLERGINYSKSRREGDSRPPPSRGVYRLLVENLSTRISWQELKRMMKRVGTVLFADAHRERRNQGIVEFLNEKEVEMAIDKYDGLEINGRRIKLINVSKRSSRKRGKDDSSRSRSSSYEESKRRRRSRSRSRKDDEEEEDEEEKRKKKDEEERREREGGDRKETEEEEEEDREREKNEDQDEEHKENSAERKNELEEKEITKNKNNCHFNNYDNNKNNNDEEDEENNNK